MSETTHIEVLKREAEKQSGARPRIHIILSGGEPGPMKILEKNGVVAELGSENVCPHIEAALERARDMAV